MAIPVRVINSVVAGAVLATLFFFPLLNALASNFIWLHWSTQDTLETLAAWSLLSTGIGATLWLSDRSAMRITQELFYAAWLLVGGYFAIGGLVKTGLIASYVSGHRGSTVAVAGSLFVAAIIIGFFVIRRIGVLTNSFLQKFVKMMSPILLIFIFNIGNAQWQSYFLSHSKNFTTINNMVHEKSVVVFNGTRTVVLLFDELSPDYLYGSRAVDLHKFPILERLRDNSEIHRNAKLQGGSTAIAIPALFGATTTAPAGLVAALKNKGQSVRVYGWYHNYCLVMAREADICHSNSIYNPRTLGNRFSLLNPLWTNLNLLPAEPPFDQIKIPAAVEFHRRTLSGAALWLRQQLADPNADFIYVHINVPHLPLLTEHLDILSAPHPFKFSEDGYISQLTQVENFIAEVFSTQEKNRPLQLVIMSDHNARPLFPINQHENIVFMLKRPKINYPIETITSENAAELLARISLQ